MRKILAVAAVGLASVAFGVGVGSSSAFNASGEVSDPGFGVVRIAETHEGYCPFGRGTPTEETSA